MRTCSQQTSPTWLTWLQEGPGLLYVVLVVHFFFWAAYLVLRTTKVYKTPLGTWTWFRSVGFKLGLSLSLLWLGHSFVYGLLLPYVQPRKKSLEICQSVLLQPQTLPQPFRTWEVFQQDIEPQLQGKQRICSLLLRPRGYRFRYEPYPQLGDSYLRIRIYERGPSLPFAVIAGQYRPMKEPWLIHYQACYARRSYWYQLPRESIAYVGVYRDVYLEVTISGDARHYPDALQVILTSLDEKIGRWAMSEAVERINAK